MKGVEEIDKENLTRGINKKNMIYLNRFESYNRLNLEESTIKLQMQILYRFGRHFRIDFDKATPNNIINYFNKRKSNELSDKYLAQEILYINKLFRF